MNEETLSTRRWLLRELDFIAAEMAHTLNGQMAGQLESCSEDDREITLRFPLQPWEANGRGTLHGGMLSTMMDLTMSMAVHCFSRESIPPTVSMTVNYLRPVPMDGDILIRARLTSLGRRNATAYCEAILPHSGKVACTALGTFAIL